MDRETLIKRNAMHGLETAIEISHSMVHLRKEHAIMILSMLKEKENNNTRKEGNKHDH